MSRTDNVTVDSGTHAGSQVPVGVFCNMLDSTGKEWIFYPPLRESLCGSPGLMMSEVQRHGHGRIRHRTVQLVHISSMAAYRALPLTLSVRAFEGAGGKVVSDLRGSIRSSLRAICCEHRQVGTSPPELYCCYPAPVGFFVWLAHCCRCRSAILPSPITTYHYSGHSSRPRGVHPQALRCGWAGAEATSRMVYR